MSAPQGLPAPSRCVTHVVSSGSRTGSGKKARRRLLHRGETLVFCLQARMPPATMIQPSPCVPSTNISCKRSGGARTSSRERTCGICGPSRQGGCDAGLELVVPTSVYTSSIQFLQVQNLSCLEQAAVRGNARSACLGQGLCMDPLKFCNIVCKSRKRAMLPSASATHSSSEPLPYRLFESVRAIPQLELIARTQAAKEGRQLLGALVVRWIHHKHFEHVVYPLQRQGLEVSEHPNHVGLIHRHLSLPTTTSQSA
eukprot:scaffold38_cov415-Prasinococcus_capsulatus_cf.AAC.2